MCIEDGNPSTDHLQGSCYETLDTVSGCFHWNACFCNKISTSAGRWTILNLRFKVFWVRNMGTKHYISYSSLKALLFSCNIFAVALFIDPMNNSNIMLKSEHRMTSQIHPRSHFMQRHFIPASQPHILFVFWLFYLDSIQSISVKKRNTLQKNVAALRLWHK